MGKLYYILFEMYIGHLLTFTLYDIRINLFNCMVIWANDLIKRDIPLLFLLKLHSKVNVTSIRFGHRLTVVDTMDSRIFFFKTIFWTIKLYQYCYVFFLKFQKCLYLIRVTSFSNSWESRCYLIKFRSLIDGSDIYMIVETFTLHKRNWLMSFFYPNA